MEKETLDKFIIGMIEAGREITKARPNAIIAPINGAVPLIDVLNIVDQDFDNSLVYYMLASSKLVDINANIKKWTTNFLKQNCPAEDEYNIVVVDEVVNGNSSVRIYKAMREAINAYARLKAAELGMQNNNNIIQEIKRRIHYKGVGVKDEKCPIKSKEYISMVEKGLVKYCNVGRIITMDHPEYTPVQFRFEIKEGRLLFYPEITAVNISKQYMELLENIAKSVGADPETLTPKNINKIITCTRYLT